MIAYLLYRRETATYHHPFPANKKMKNYYSISFVSMSIGWIGLILTHIVWSVINYNDASAGDTGVIIF